MEEFSMKILLATVALATLVSSSAHAQYGVWRGDYRAYAQVPRYAAYRSYGFNRAYAQVPPYAAYRFNRAYAQVPPYAAYRSYGFNRAYAQVPPYAAYYGAYAQAPYFSTPGFYDVYGRRSPYPYSVYDIRGAYVGSDPDPRVRSQLARDPTQGGE
jgi:hypothetical protein